MSFCTGCGSPLDDDVKFCSRCGAARGAESPATITAAQSPAPNKRSHLGLKILLGVVGLFAVLVIGGIGTVAVKGVNFHKAVSAEVSTQFSSDGKSLKSSSSASVAFDAKAVAKDHFGVDVYPSVKPAMEFDGTDKSLAFQTADPIEKVDAFYRALPGANVIDESPAHRTFEFSNDKGATRVELASSRDGTTIRHTRAAASEQGPSEPQTDATSKPER